MLGAGRVGGSHGGAGGRPGLLHAEGSKSEGGNEVLRGERDSVSAVTVIRGVHHEGDVVREHFMDIKDDTRVRGTTEGVRTGNRKRIRSGGREQLDGGGSGAG